MKCSNCGKEINIEDACRCSSCGSDYCPECASAMKFCSCFGEFTRYN